MKKPIAWSFILLCSMILLMGFSGNILAENKGFIAIDFNQNLSKIPDLIQFEHTGSMGKVEFDLEAHAEVNSCRDCHGGVKPIFHLQRTKEGFKMDDFAAGKYCGACHDGKKAFSSKENCGKCHSGS